ncbi:DUF4383 domain-containing protein [Acidicapsa dinghuensis]|uniref:DUF4383 domain-containing protein n=1 Tax=Acidicapsa dinghuensis TaxID=2218256 RepID=A0ABW1EC47_9BACT|nr:DUF4383 domain-containing protein [Acidicapsa dinghuensis]
MTKFTMLTKITMAALVALAIALWIQWLSGDPSYPKFPPGPVIFLAIVGVMAWGRRWWWTPALGALIALLVTSGSFARMPAEIVRLTHPGSLGHFAAGIFVGKVLQLVALVVADVAGVAATIQNYRRRTTTGDGAQMACRFFGGIFVLMCALVMAGGIGDRYHNLMHLVWGALALGVSFLGATASKRYCIGSGLFYLTLAMLGLVLGNSAMNRAWYFGPIMLHTGDDIFHLVLGSIFLAIGIFSGREQKLHTLQHAE